MEQHTPPAESVIVTRPLEEADIPAVVALHRRHLGYSINCRLGTAHLSYLYRVTMNDADSMVMVAIRGNEVAGVVSATLDPERLMGRLLRSLGLGGWLQLLGRIIRHPGALVEWFESRDLGRPVILEGDSTVTPCLTAIAVDSSIRKSGIGKALVAEVEAFCRARSYPAFRLDTREDNETSRLFYRRLDFSEVEKRGKNIVLVKIL